MFTHTYTWLHKQGFTHIGWIHLHTYTPIGVFTHIHKRALKPNGFNMLETPHDRCGGCTDSIVIGVEGECHLKGVGFSSLGIGHLASSKV